MLCGILTHLIIVEEQTMRVRWFMALRVVARCHSRVRDIISLIMLKNGVAEDVLIVFCNKKLYLCIEKKYEIRDHTPDFHIKFRSTLSFFCRIIYKRIFDIEQIG